MRRVLIYAAALAVVVALAAGVWWLAASGHYCHTGCTDMR